MGILLVHLESLCLRKAKSKAMRAFSLLLYLGLPMVMSFCVIRYADFRAFTEMKTLLFSLCAGLIAVCLFILTRVHSNDYRPKKNNASVDDFSPEALDARHIWMIQEIKSQLATYVFANSIVNIFLIICVMLLLIIQGVFPALVLVWNLSIAFVGGLALETSGIVLLRAGRLLFDDVAHKGS